MKGLHYVEQVAGSMRDVQNRRTFPQQKLAVPDEKLTILQHKGEMIVIEKIDIPKGTQFTEVEVPEQLISAARKLISAKIEFNGLRDVFKSTIGQK